MREAELEIERGLDLKQLPADAGPAKYAALLEAYEVARSEAVKLQFGGGSVLMYPSDDPLEYVDLDLLREYPGLAEWIIMAPEGVGIRKPDESVEPGDHVKMVGGEDGVTPPTRANTNPAPRPGRGGGGISVGAYLDPDGEPIDTPQAGEIAWNGYVRISIPDDESGFGWCSGVLITPNLVLTAAHCTRTVPSVVQIGGTRAEWTQPENRYRVVGCKTHGDAIPSLHLGGHKAGDCGLGGMPKIRPKHDLAILSLDRQVPPEQATPRSLLLSAQPNEIAIGLMMFGYGYVGHVGTEPPKCNQVDGKAVEDGVVVLAKSRQRMRGVVQSREPEKLSVVAEPPDGHKGVYGAVCGDSGGPLTMTIGATQRELVIGVLSIGNRANGAALAAALYHEENRKFILEFTGRQLTQIDGFGVLNGVGV